MMIEDKQRLIGLIKSSGALSFGDFLLRSGARSSYYLDMRKLTLSWALGVIVDEFYARLSGIPFDAIGGPSLGADPIVGGYLVRASNSTLRGFLIRKEEKEHGLAGLVIGSVLPGDRCVVVEDVTTSGGSLIKAIDAVTEFGATVVHAAAIVDRTGDVVGTLKARGIGFTSLVDLEELGV